MKVEHAISITPSEILKLCDNHIYLLIIFTSAERFIMLTTFFLGDHLYQCNGAKCDKMEKFSAAAYLQDLETKRKVNTCDLSVLDIRTYAFSDDSHSLS